MRERNARRHTVEVDGDVDDTLVLLITDQYLMIFVFKTSCTDRCWSRTVAPVNSSTTRNKKAVLSQRWPRDARYISRSWAVAEIWPFEIIQDGGGRHLEFIRIENSAIRTAVSENPTLLPNMKWIGLDDRLQRYGHLKFFQDGGGSHLWFVRTGNSAIRSAVSENPTLWTKHKVDRTIGCGDIATWNFSNMAVAAILDLFES